MHEHSGRRRLPVGSGHRDQTLPRAELGEQLAAVDHALTALPGRHKLGVVLRNCGGDDDVGTRRDSGGGVADACLDAGGAHAREI